MTLHTIDTLENHISTAPLAPLKNVLTDSWVERKWKRAMPFYHPLLLQCPLFVYNLDEFLLSSINGSRVSFRSRSTVQNLRSHSSDKRGAWGGERELADCCVVRGNASAWLGKLSRMASHAGHENWASSLGQAAGTRWEITDIRHSGPKYLQKCLSSHYICMHPYIPVCACVCLCYSQVLP